MWMIDWNKSQIVLQGNGTNLIFVKSSTPQKQTVLLGHSIDLVFLPEFRHSMTIPIPQKISMLLFKIRNSLLASKKRINTTNVTFTRKHFLFKFFFRRIVAVLAFRLFFVVAIVFSMQIPISSQPGKKILSSVKEVKSSNIAKMPFSFERFTKIIAENPINKAVAKERILGGRFKLLRVEDFRLAPTGHSTANNDSFLLSAATTHAVWILNLSKNSLQAKPLYRCGEYYAFEPPPNAIALLFRNENNIPDYLVYPQSTNINSHEKAPYKQNSVNGCEKFADTP